jgi:hypothetical protein
MKHYDRADSFLYSDLCIPVTTEMNPTKHTKSTTNCGKDKLSDS